MLKIFKINDGLEVAVELVEDNGAPYLYVYLSVGLSQVWLRVLGCNCGLAPGGKGRGVFALVGVEEIIPRSKMLTSRFVA
jgi:membrane associated rhomboid family serine protease